MTTFLRVETVAARLDVSPNAIYREIRRGALQAIHIGRVIRVSEEQLEAYINRPQEDADAKAGGR